MDKFPVSNDSIHASELFENDNAKLLKESRIGCAYCLRTLSPHDANLSLREIVKVDNNLYHAYCWRTFLQEYNPELKSISHSLQEPFPLVAAKRIPVEQGYHHTDISDVPLGLSIGTLVVNAREFASQPHNITLRNNSTQPIRLSRLIDTGWAFFDFGRYDERSSSTQIMLLPGEQQSVNIYSHIARPDITQRMVLFNQDTVLLLKSANSLWPLAVATTILGVSLFSLFIVLWNCVRAYYLIEAGGYLLTNVTLFTMLAATTCFFLLPSATLWTLYKVLGRIKSFSPFRTLSLVQDHIEELQHLIWTQFARNRVQFLFQHPIHLLIVSVIAGVIMSLISLVAWGFLVFGILQFLIRLLGSFSGLVAVLGIGVLFYLFFAFVLETYELHILLLTRQAAMSLIQRGHILIKSMNK